MKNLNKDGIYVWACDFSKSRGEGLLGRNFIYNCSQHTSKNFYINGLAYSYSKKQNIKIKTNLIHNYLYPFLGVIKIWYQHLSKKKTIYLNYLPLWNFLIFLLLPKKTLLGPITGGAYYGNSKSLNSFIRRYIFPFFYLISLKIIEKKYSKVIFSTNLLKSYVNKKNKYLFNYCLNIYEEKLFKQKKKYDLIFYYRPHKNRNNFEQKKLIKKLVDNYYNVIIIGDNPYIEKSLYLGNLTRDNALKYMQQSKFAINNNENIYSLFCLDALSSGTKVINFRNKKVKENFFDNGAIIQKKIDNVDKQFLWLKKLLESRNRKKISANKNYFNNKKKIKNYFLNLNL